MNSRRLIILILSLLAGTLFMNRYTILFHVGEFARNAKLNVPAHFLLLEASKTNNKELKAKSYTQMARIAYVKKRYDAALALALEAVESNSLNDAAWYIAASMENLLENDYKKAISYIDNAIKINPNQPSYYDLKLTVLGKQMRYSEALKIVDYFINAFPNHPDIEHMREKKQAGLLLLKKSNNI